MVAILKTDGYIGVGKQALFGTPVAPITNLYAKYLSESLTNEQDDIKGQEGGFGRYMIEAYKAQHRSAGDIQIFARPDLCGFFLHALLGNDAYSAGTPSVHVITPSTPKFLTIERGIKAATPTLIERFQDLVINEMTIEGEAGQPIKMTANFMGTKSVRQAAASTPSYEVNDPIMFWDTPVYSIDGAPNALMSKFSIKISNNIEAWLGQSMTPADFIEKLLTVEVAFTLKFENADHYRRVYFGGATASDIVDTIYDGAIDFKAGYGLTTAERMLQIAIPHIKHKAAPVNIAGDAAPIFQECQGYAIKIGADQLITASLKNSYASDYDA